MDLADARIAPAGPSAWLSRGLRSRRTRLLAVGALLAGSGAALAVALVGRGGSAAMGAPASLSFGTTELVGDLPGYDAAPDAAVDASRRAAVVWTRAGRVVVSVRAPGGDWSAPVRLSDPTRRAANPRIGAGGEGAFTVIWRERIPGRAVSRALTLSDGSPAGTLQARVGTRWRIAARSTTRGGGWAAVEQVSEPTGALRDVYRPELSVSAAGTATAVFVAGGAAVAARRSADGTWPARPIGETPGGAADVRLQGDRGSGRSVATWQTRVVDPSLGPRWRAWAAVSDDSGAWSAPHELGSSGPGKRVPAAAIGPDGTVVVAWGDRGFLATVRDRSGDWSPPETALAAPQGDVDVLDPPAVAVDGRGVPVLVGVHYRVTRFRGGYSGRPLALRMVRRVGDDWGPPRAIGGSPLGLALVPDAAGGLVLVSGPRAGVPGVAVRPIALDGSVGEPRPAGAGSAAARLAVGEDGTSVLVGLRPSAVVAAVAPAGGTP